MAFGTSFGVVLIDQVHLRGSLTDKGILSDRMKGFVVFAILVVVSVAEKLQSNYLPPLSAKTAGGAGFLAAPRPSFPAAPRTATSFTPSAPATSYAAPPSGPIPSGLYNAPVHTYSTGIPVAILRLNNENNGDGAYRFEYETENKISQQEQGHLQNAGSNQESSVVHGSYSYQAPDGQTITVSYVADENGFRATGDHIPTPPPVPEAIQKSIAINAAAGSNTGYSASSSSTFGTTSSSSFGGSYQQQSQVSREYLAPKAQPSGGYRY